MTMKDTPLRSLDAMMAPQGLADPMAPPPNPAEAPC